MLAPATLLAYAIAAAAPAAPAPAGVVARIGSYELTAVMLDALYAALPGSRRAVYERGAGKAAFLEDLVAQKLAVAAAVRAGYLDRPAVRAAWELAQDAVLFQAYIEDEVTSQVVTEEALRAWHASHLDRFKVEEMARVRHIVATPHKDTRIANSSGSDATSATEARAKIERLRAEILAGADFAAVAARESEDAAAPEGGLLDDFPRGHLAPAIDAAAFSLAPGAVSEIVETTYGVHLIKVEARLAPRHRTLDEVRPQVAGAVAEEKRADIRRRFDEVIARLREASKVEIEVPLPPAGAP